MFTEDEISKKIDEEIFKLIITSGFDFNSTNEKVDDDFLSLLENDFQDFLFQDCLQCINNEYTTD